MSGITPAGYYRGPYKVVHSTAGTTGAPSGSDGLDLATAFGQRRPDALSILVVPAASLTLTNLIPWSRVGSTWVTMIAPGGTTDVTHASVALTTAKALDFRLDLPVHDRLAFQFTVDTSNVTISAAGIYRMG